MVRNTKNRGKNKSAKSLVMQPKYRMRVVNDKKKNRKNIKNKIDNDDNFYYDDD